MSHAEVLGAMNKPGAAPKAPAAGLLQPAAHRRLSQPFLGRKCAHERGVGSGSAGHARPQQLSARASAAPTQMQAPPGQQPPPETKYEATEEALRVTAGVTVLRSVCTTRLPEIEFGQKRGTTTNTYLLRGAGGGYEALIDVPSKLFDLDFVRDLRDAGALRTLRTIVITRLTPERIPVLRAVVAAAEGPLTLAASNPALQLLRDKAESDPQVAAMLADVTTVTATRGTEVRLSSGNTLRFFPIPTPRWPDLVAVYSPGDQVLFTSNFFSAHAAPAVPAPGAAPSPFDDGGWGQYGPDWQYYFDCMLAPVARQATTALGRLAINAVPAADDGGPLAALLAPLRAALRVVSDITLGADDGVPEPLAVAVLAPMHGPCVRTALTELVGRYGSWSAAQVKASSQAFVAVLYASAYGNTASLAQAISRGVTKAGVGVETLNLELVTVEEVEATLAKAAGFVLGSPTLGGHMPTQVQTVLGAILKASEARGLPCGVFGSFGWSGEAVDKMEGRLKDAGFRFAFDAIRCKFKPTEGVLQVCEESGTDLAQAIRKRLKQKERTAAEKLSVAETASGRAQAVGRVVGSLCVATARDGDAESAMLASWVSQASFDPPGLTVAVKKDRAIESLLVVGNRFNLNVLAEGKDKAVVKALLKPFKPGEDRFEGLDVQRSEVTGAAILPAAAAYLECTVGGRLEAGDHWLVYASVEGGKVLDEGANSAVHFRKVGTSY